MQTDRMRALCTQIVPARHMKRSFLVQRGTSILDYLALFSHLHSFTGTIGIFYAESLIAYFKALENLETLKYVIKQDFPPL